MIRRLLGAAVLLLCVLGLSVGTSRAAQPPGKIPHKCFVAVNGVIPTCEKNADGTWTPNYDDGTDLDGQGGSNGIPSGLIGLMVVFVIVGVGVSIARIVYVRNMASKAGLDPNQATAVSLLSNDGIDATYLAANLRRDPAGAPQPAPGNTQDRLNELQQLRDSGSITAEEYASRRKDIIDSI